MMRMRLTTISLLSLAFFLLKVSAKLSLPFYLPTNETFGFEVGNTSAPSYPQGRCGWQADGRKCPTGLCCSLSGWCGTTSDYCSPNKCQSQCHTAPPPPPSPPPPSPPPPPSIPQGRCGKQADGRKCPTGVCCNILGWCGTTSDYCDPNICQSQCSGPFPQGRCGWQAEGRICPTGVCCSISGWCGTTADYCAPNNCQSQCDKAPPPPPSPPPPSVPQGRCGKQADGRKCPTGVCCNILGWCGTTSEYCDPNICQSQCSGPFPQGRCGWQAEDRTCPTGVCCSISGWCGTTTDYCAPNNCQSQCKNLTSSTKNHMRGIESFLLNVV